MANIIDRNRPEVIPLKPYEIPGYGIMEDSRTREPIHDPSGTLIRTFCSNCGVPYGWTNEESYDMIRAQEVIVLCEECEAEINAKCGSIPLPVAGTKEMTSLPKPEEQGIVIVTGFVEGSD